LALGWPEEFRKFAGECRTMAKLARSPESHVVERYRLLDYEAAKEGWERNAKENFRVPNSDVSAEVDPA
jgi:hypothetical protein